MYVHRDTQPAFFSFFFLFRTFSCREVSELAASCCQWSYEKSFSTDIFLHFEIIFYIYIYICWLKNIRIIMEFWIQFFSILLECWIQRRKKLNDWEIFYYLIVYFLLVEKAIFLKRVCTFNGWLRGLIWIMNVRLHTLAWIKKIDGAYIS